ncbi:hypothetical protein SAMN04244560_01046 [Thermoanaerobacter thermohydrosulfuricus]|uniref:Uncharacterized protein n=1 Tax=Thermoanaerobacter thermohydrosulfuricus TaxID=1516 RepID=A0A1G7MXL0_THETY|nr:hypothetical protein [Thermoanaerobacter thermohydrosulfuricus]SDF66411.1 hypothetical protein SAMN04244560_01046 [Thermoanaerobacter thermohydrosulfuricus]
MRASLEYLFGWGYRDIEKLEELLEAAEKFNIYPDEILEDIREIENDPTDINSWIYSTMSLLFYKIMDKKDVIIEEVINALKEM